MLAGAGAAAMGMYSHSHSAAALVVFVLGSSTRSYFAFVYRGQGRNAHSSVEQTADTHQRVPSLLLTVLRPVTPKDTHDSLEVVLVQIKGEKKRLER